MDFDAECMASSRSAVLRAAVCRFSVSLEHKTDMMYALNVMYAVDRIITSITMLSVWHEYGTVEAAAARDVLLWPGIPWPDVLLRYVQWNSLTRPQSTTSHSCIYAPRKEYSPPLIARFAYTGCYCGPVIDASRTSVHVSSKVTNFL